MIDYIYSMTSLKDMILAESILDVYMNASPMIKFFIYFRLLKAYH